MAAAVGVVELLERLLAGFLVGLVAPSGIAMITRANSSPGSISGSSPY